METLKLPGYAARHPRAWDPKTALRFADRLLTWLRNHLEQLPDGTRVRLEYEPRSGRNRGPNEVKLTACTDGEVPDFLPPGAREALARAAALRAAGGGVSSGGRGSSLRSKEGSDRVSGGSVGKRDNTMSSGPEASSRRSALKRASPASSKEEEVGAVAKTKSMKISVDDAHARDVGSPDTPAAPNEPKQQQQQPHRGQVQWAGAEPPAPHYNHRRRRRQERSQTPVPGARSLQHLYRYYQPIVAGPGFGDPLKMAADKQAYARSLGPSAMSYLMGFVPGDSGWIGGDENQGDDDEKNGGDGGDGGSGEERARDKEKERGYGLDPKAFEFDPMNPAAHAKAAAILTGAGSEGDGQQSSFVAAGSGEEMGDGGAGDGSGGAGSVGGRSMDSRSDASRRRSGGGPGGGSVGEREVGSTPQTATSANEGGQKSDGDGPPDEEDGGGSGTKKPRATKE